MRNILNVKFEKFIEDFNLQDGSKDANWKRFVNYHFFRNFSLGVLIRTLIYWIRYALRFPGIHRYTESFFC